MNLVKWSRRNAQPSPWPTMTIDQIPGWFGQFGYNGLGYGPSMIQTISQKRETIAGDYLAFINGAYKTSGPIFACMLVRMMLFSEARLQFQRVTKGRPGILFGTPDLDILEHPWPNATTGDLMARAINDVDLAGNFYCTRGPLQRAKGSKIIRLRPDWVTILKGSIEDADISSVDPSAELVGYIYTPGGPGSGAKPHFYLPEEICHFSPIVDPAASYRGMSWVQPILNEVLGDKAMGQHKVSYFNNGATPNLVVSMDTGKMDRKTFKEWTDMFEAEHQGSTNAFRTLYLGSGSSATVVGSNLKDLDYSAVQGHGETRIAAAAGLPPIIVGFSEALSAATYSNYGQARRAVADQTLRPLWRNFVGSMETLVPPPGGSRLWYDDRDVAFLQADAQDGATVQLTKATAIKMLVDSGYDPDSVVNAMENDDFSLLDHSGLYSVQLQPAGSQNPGAVPVEPVPQKFPQPPTNGTDPASTNPPQPKRLDSSTMRAILSGDIRKTEDLAQALIAARND